MASQGVAISVLLLRILALAASVTSLALVVTDNVEFNDGLNTKLRFQDVIAFRYVLAVAVISAAYTIVQLPFAVYYAVHQKKLMKNLPNFDFYGDKVISLLLATGIGAGIGVAYEFKRLYEEIFKSVGIPKSDPTRSTFRKFYNQMIIASSILCVSSLCTIVISIILIRSRKK